MVEARTDNRGHSNCGKSRTAAGVNRQKCAGCDACALRTSAASDRPTAAAPGPSCALSRAQRSPMAQPVGTAHYEIFKSDSAATLGPRKCGLSGAITAHNDRFHFITQLNARDGPAKGRTSVLIDEERVLETRAEPSARNDRSMRTSTGQSPGQLHRWMRRVARLGLPSLLAQCPWQAPVPPVHASLDRT